MRTDVIGLACDHGAKLADRIVQHPAVQMDHAELVASGYLIRIKRECPLVYCYRLVPATAVLQYVAEVGEVECVSGRRSNGPAQQRNCVVEARFTKRDEPGQMQRLGVLRI